MRTACVFWFKIFNTHLHSKEECSLMIRQASNKKITIGMCVRNSGKTIQEAVDSIVIQNYPHELIDVIVVDGCSEDDTLFLVKNTALKSDITFRFFSDKGKGLGVARQIVVDNTKSEYIIWIDGDMQIEKEFIKKQVSYMENNPKVGVALGRPDYSEGTLVATLRSLLIYTRYFKLVSQKAQGKSGDMLASTNGAIHRVEAIKKIGGFDINIKGASEDADLIIRLQKNGWLRSLIPEAKFFHEYRENWTDLWREQYWFGYGGHFMSHKFIGHTKLWKKIPFFAILDGLGLSKRAFKLIHKKKSFLLPFLVFFQKIAFWSGFLESHINGYGHN